MEEEEAQENNRILIKDSKIDYESDNLDGAVETSETEYFHSGDRSSANLGNNGDLQRSESVSIDVNGYLFDQVSLKEVVRMDGESEVDHVDLNQPWSSGNMRQFSGGNYEPSELEKVDAGFNSSSIPDFNHDNNIPMYIRNYPIFRKRRIVPLSSEQSPPIHISNRQCLLKEKKPKSSHASTISIEELFTSIDRHVQRSEFEEVIKVADQVLSVAPGDEDVMQCKVVALFKCDKIDEALSSIQKVPRDFSFFKGDKLQWWQLLISKSRICA